MMSICIVLIKSLIFILVIHHLLLFELKHIFILIFTLFLSFVPDILNKYFKIKISTLGILIYIIFIFCSLYLALVHNFYSYINIWDKILHFISGIWLVSFAVGLIKNKNRIEIYEIIIFAFMFSIAFAGIWEIFEYTVDSILCTNTQRWLYNYNNYNDLIGISLRDPGLIDTMRDMICGCLGTIIGIIAEIKHLKDK